MKHNSKVNIAIFLTFIFGVGIFNLSFFQSDKISSLEQRALTQKPVLTLTRLFKGEFTREFDNYFADHFVFRNTLVKVGSRLMNLIGLPGSNEATLVRKGGDNTSKNNTSSAAQYLILNGQSYTMFQYSPGAAEAYAKALNRYKQAVGSKVRVYSLLAPTSAEFIGNDKYKSMTDSQKKAFAHINELLDPEIVQINAYDALAQHSKEYVYFRTDHHWTALGAYYAYTKTMEAMGQQATPLSRYEKGNIEQFLGSAYKATLNYKLKANPDTITYYKPFVNYSFTRYLSNGKMVEQSKVVSPDYAKPSIGLYSAFLGGDFPLGEISTGNKNGKKMMVVKDSYGNALIPFLLPHFEKIYIVDPRFYKESLTDFVKKQGITDILFLNNSTVARTTGIADLLNQLMGNKK